MMTLNHEPVREEYLADLRAAVAEVRYLADLRAAVAEVRAGSGAETEMKATY